MNTSNCYLLILTKICSNYIDYLPVSSSLDLGIGCISARVRHLECRLDIPLLEMLIESNCHEVTLAILVASLTHSSAH